MRVKICAAVVFVAACIAGIPNASVAAGGTVDIIIDLTPGVDDPCLAKATADSAATEVEAKVAVSKDMNSLDADNPEVRRLTIDLTPNGAASSTRLALSGTGGTKLLATGGPAQLDKYDDAIIVVKRAGSVFCTTTVALKEADQTCSGATQVATKRAIDHIHAERKFDSLVDKDGVVTRTIVIPILPDGTRYGDLPSDITERDKFLLVAVVPSNAKVEWQALDADGKTLHSTTCNAPPLYRNLITSGAEEKKDGTKAATVPGPKPLGSIKELWHAPFGHGCENSLSYVVKITLEGCETAPIVAKESITTEKVFDFLLGAGFGYDFGTPADYSSKASLSGTTTQQVLVRTRDQTGLKPIVTLSYFPFGANPNKWECRNWVSPFIGLDPSRFDKGAIAGINFQPFGIAFSLLAGVSVYQSEELSSPLGLKPGDVIPMGTEISTRDTFNSDGVGFYFGDFTTESLKLFFTKGAEAFGAAAK